MNRLWVRLSLAFVAVILLTVILVAIFSAATAGSEFQQYLARRDSFADSGLIDDLAAYYQQNRSWQGVEQVFAANNLIPGRSGAGMMRGRPAMLVTDPTGKIVYDTRGERIGNTLSSSEQASALPIRDGSTVVGTFVFMPGRGGAMQPAEQNFLDRLRGTLVIAALVAGGIGIVFGLLISRMVAQPLSSLATVATAFAHKEWQQRASLRGTYEVQQVATAFNTMADSLQQSETLRRNLTADIAHELRTPLTVMQGNLQAMLEGIYPLERSEIAAVYDETRLLSRLVNDLRELAMADAGQLPLNLQRVDLAAVLQQAMTTFTFAAEEKGLHVSTTIPASLPPVQADPDRLKQVLHNLLANALRHTDSGTIAVSVQAQDSTLHIDVTDTGEGIAPEDLPHVFERFYRVEKDTRSSTGLGLAIARTWIHAMQGQIGVESTLGQGSRFWFSLPAVPARTPAPAQPA